MDYLDYSCCTFRVGRPLSNILCPLPLLTSPHSIPIESGVCFQNQSVRTQSPQTLARSPPKKTVAYQISNYFQGTWPPSKISWIGEQTALIERIETAKDNFQNLVVNIPQLPSFAPSEYHFAQSKLIDTLCRLWEKLSYFFSVLPPDPLPPVDTQAQVEDAARVLLHVRLFREKAREPETAADVLRTLERLLKHQFWWDWTESVDS
jgi:hypothetical protein